MFRLRVVISPVRQKSVNADAGLELAVALITDFVANWFQLKRGRTWWRCLPSRESPKQGSTCLRTLMPEQTLSNAPHLDEQCR